MHKHTTTYGWMLALFLGSVASAAGTACAQNYYVDFEGGSNGNSGRSPASAFKHCPGDREASGRAANTGLKPGDTVIFKGGVHYRGSIEARWSGEKGGRITYDGNTAGTFGQGRAILDGSEIVTGWKRCRSAAECGGNPNWKNIYWAHAPKLFSAMTAGVDQDGRLLYPAQYPNPKDPFWSDDRGSFLPLRSGITKTSITDPRLGKVGSLVDAYAIVASSANSVGYRASPATKGTRSRSTG